MLEGDRPDEFARSAHGSAAQLKLAAEHLTQRLEGAASAGRMGVWSSLAGVGGTEWNAQMHELFDMVGEAPPQTLADALQRCVHPDDAKRVQHAARAYLGGKSNAFEIEFRVRRRDASIRWILLRAEVGHDPRDSQRVYGVALDVTDRHAAAAALHAASERSALITRSAGIGTWETSPEHDDAQWDAQMFALRGLAPQAGALDRETRFALVHPDDRAHVLGALPHQTTHTQPCAYEFRVRQPDGSYRWLASRSAVLRDAHGNALRRVGVNWDITDARSAEQARQQALLAERESRAKSQFLSRMSHELRTPLNAVLGFTQLLQVEAQRAALGGEPVQLDKLGHIRAAGEHLLALIDDVLDLSSLESGALQLAREPVDVAATVAQTLSMRAALAAQQQVGLRAGPLAGTALADPARLRQVLMNLLAHAIRSSRPQGEVLVDAQARGERIHLWVRYAGREVPAERSAQLFEPFEPLGAEGAGIGLTIARALVQGMGGSIAAPSAPGCETVFELTLTAHRADVSPGASEKASVEASADAVRATDVAPTGRSGQLLYIEDNDVNVLLVEELVRSVSGLRIVSEPTGAKGVERAMRLQPDLVLIDLQLPDFDGFEVLRRLRAQPQTAGIPCIALSANALPEDIARGLAAGFDDYWTKPIRFKPFLAALERRFPARPA